MFGGKVKLLTDTEKLMLRKGETDQLCEALAKIKKIEEARAFIRDLLTVREHREIARRLEIARMLEEGFDYLTIQQALEVGVATIARVNQSIKSGNGGCLLIINRLSKREFTPQPDYVTKDPFERYLSNRIKKINQKVFTNGV